MRAVLVGEVAPPDVLLLCFVEDWTEPADVAWHTFTEDCSNAAHGTGGYADCDLSLTRLAERRQSEDRAAWFAEHGAPEVWPAASPRWRQPPPMSAPPLRVRSSRRGSG